jgi:hypothetical protein
MISAWNSSFNVPQQKPRAFQTFIATMKFQGCVLGDAHVVPTP